MRSLWQLFPLITIAFFSFNAMGQVYNCTFNKAADQKSLSGSDLKKNVESFVYNPKKEVGKNIALDPYKLLVWHKGGHLNVKFIGGEFKKPLSIQFHDKQKHIRFNYGSRVDFTCKTDEMTDAQKATTLSKEKKIGDFQENVTFEVTKDITFTYKQSEENQMMRTVFFQNGKTFVNSNEMESKLPWCSLRVQLKRNEDTVVEKGSTFKPLTFQKQENNNYFTTFSYAFVDFNKGKKVTDELLYTPYMLNCNILRGMPFKIDTFKSVVDNYLTIKSTL